MGNDTGFLEFKKLCSASGTTEESIANAEKIGFKTNLIATNPLNPNRYPSSPIIAASINSSDWNWADGGFDLSAENNNVVLLWLFYC